MSDAKRAILLLAHGTPETLDDIPEYLKNVTSGRAMPPAVIEEIRHRYGLIGRSPLTEWTFAQARQLEAVIGLPVFVGMRNWKPYIADTVREMREQNVTETVAICLAPQNSRTSVGLYRRAAYAEAGDAMQLSFVDAWADHPLLVQSFAEKLAPAYEAARKTGGRTAVVFTAHSVPCHTVQVAAATEPATARQEIASPDPYPVEAKRTAALVAATVGVEDWYFAFQSQGMSGGPWVGPSVEDTLRAIKDSGYDNVVVQPVGFLCDHVEILYDIDIAFRGVAEEVGLHLTRPESLNGSRTLTAALADLAVRAFRKLADAPAVAAALMRIAVVGGGIAGLSAAYELAIAGADFVLFEASERLGGIVETVRERDFIVECGPYAWVTEKPWARELAVELGLESELLASNDATRKTYIAENGQLIAIPDGMRMMVPADLAALDASHLFDEEAKRAFRAEPERAEELKAAAPAEDESVASFVIRHFGGEVATKIAAPLLAGVFGGDIARLSVRTVMPAFVKMEREHGSLVLGLQMAARGGGEKAIFTTLASGLSTLVDRMAAKLPAGSLRMKTAVTRLIRVGKSWRIADEEFDAVVLAVPAEVASALIKSLDGPAAALLPQHSSSAVVVALGFDADAAKSLPIPAGFGFLVPQSGRQDASMLAATFTHQKFAQRAAEGAVLLRAFFGGAAAESLIARDDGQLAQLALSELSRYLGALPLPEVTVVRRWPRSLPQYEVGHQERIAEFGQRIGALRGLRCIGNAYHGVGLPDLVREGRAAARNVLGG